MQFDSFIYLVLIMIQTTEGNFRLYHWCEQYYIDAYQLFDDILWLFSKYTICSDILPTIL